MLREGDHAPDFELPGYAAGETDTYRLRDAVDDDTVALLLFYVADFSPACTSELCILRDAEWLRFTPNLEVWGISADSTYAHRRYAEQYDVTFPLLSDNDTSTAEAYDVRYDEWEGHAGIPKRSVFVVDTDQTIQYSWVTEDAYSIPEFTPVREVVHDCTPGESAEY